MGSSFSVKKWGIRHEAAREDSKAENKDNYKRLADIFRKVNKLCPAKEGEFN